MKNLYAFTDTVEEKIDNLDAVDTRDDALELIGMDPYEATLGECFFKLFEYALEIPTGIWSKKLVDLTPEDVKILESLETELMTFKKA